MNAHVPLPTYHPKSPWSDQAIKAVKRLSADGKSARQIAKVMSAEYPSITRNAVIGKLARLGVKSINPIGAVVGHASTRPKRRAAPQIARWGLRTTAQAPRVGRGVPAPESKWISIVDLEATSCRWPRGTPGAADFAYCGAPIEAGHPYCPYHCGLAYVGRLRLTQRQPRETNGS